MDQFQIPPEYCLIVRAFNQTHSLREAAVLLGCDPASLVRKAQKIAAEHHLLQKIRGKWTLTDSGRRAAQWVEESMAFQRELMNERPRLRISSTMWFAEQALIPNLESLLNETSLQSTWSIQTTASDFEAELLDAATDFVIVCHPPRDPSIAHRRVAPEKWVVIAPTEWKRVLSKLSTTETQAFLREKPYIRHASINPASGIQIGGEFKPSPLITDSLITVRSAVESGLGWSCVPELTVRSRLKATALATIDLPTSFQGDVCLWWLRSRRDTTRHTKALTTWLARICQAQ